MIGAFGTDLLGDPWAWDIDKEGNLPSAVSAALFLSAASLVLVAGRDLGSGRGRADTWMHVAAALLAFVAIDEFLVVHERLEAATGVDWTLLYTPLYPVALLAGLAVLRALDRRSSGLFIAGAALLATAPLLEVIQYDDGRRVDAYPVLMAVEELGAEMAGAAMVAASLIVFIRRLRGDWT